MKRTPRIRVPQTPTIDNNVKGVRRRPRFVIIATTEERSVFDDDFEVKGETIAWSDIDGDSE